MLPCTIQTALRATGSRSAAIPEQNWNASKDQRPTRVCLEGAKTGAVQLPGEDDSESSLDQAKHLPCKNAQRGIARNEMLYFHRMLTLDQMEIPIG